MQQRSRFLEACCLTYVELKSGAAYLPGWRDAYSVGAAGAELAAGDGVGLFVEADFDCGEVVAAAAQGEAGAGDGRVGFGEEAEDLRGRERDLLVECGQGLRDLNGVEGLPRELEEGVGSESGAGSVGLPLVLEQAGVGVDVAVLRGVRRAGRGGAVLREGSVVVLGPEAVQDEGGVLGALDVAGVRVAVLR